MSPWDRLQEDAFQRLWDRLVGGRALCAVAPTGFGKTRIAEMAIREAERLRWPWVFYTHRKTLFAQTHRHLLSKGIHHGCRAAEWRDYQAKLPGQLAMFQTEMLAVKKHRVRELAQAKLVVVDEAHCNKSGWQHEVIQAHLKQGAAVVGLTATTVPGMPYHDLLTLSSNSQLREVGGILLAETETPDEVDLKDVGRIPDTGASSKMGQLFMCMRVVGSIIGHYRRLNPDQLPTVGFGPSVPACYWLVDRFNEQGIQAAHIDGSRIYRGRTNGKPLLEPSAQQNRDRLIEDLVSGRIKVLWNRFVFREGVDIKEIGHGIFATTFGSEEAYVQAGGRFLRSAPGLQRIIIQDHGGNWWRHGSLNDDRDWQLQGVCARGGKAESLKQCPKCHKKSPRREWHQKDQACPCCGFRPDPKRCPGCGKPIRWQDWKKAGGCPYCGKQFTHSVRKVFQTNGTLKRVRGSPKKHKPVVASAQKAWDSLYFPSRNSKKLNASTFNQLKARFSFKFPRYELRLDRETNRTYCWDRQTKQQIALARVPRPDSGDWHLEARRVPYHNLQPPNGR